jgi:peptidyl-prolyl cis-trans isomerase B (cyclophilin B)
MFNKENGIWLYFVGIIIMFVVLVLFGKYIIPFVFNPGSINIDSNLPNNPEIVISTNLNYQAKMYTNFGVVTIDLYTKSAPKNVNNFAFLSNRGFYNQTKFHRLIPDFLIQGGDRNTLSSDISSYGKGKPNYLVDDEVNWDSLDLSTEQRNNLTNLGYKSTPNLESHKLDRYSLAMANNGPNMNGSQFFIVIASFDDSRLTDLNGKFTVIGKVVSGMDVLDTISKIAVDDANSANPKPLQDIIIQKIEVYSI